MRTTLRPAQILSISLLLFAVFFGAGGMIFRHSLDFLLERTCGCSITGFIYYRRRFIFTSYRCCCPCRW
ncbi:branched-chain amino acid transport system II carrier protein [Bacillus pacificus]